MPDRSDTLVYSSVIRQTGESQNLCFKKSKHAKFSDRRIFLTPWYAHVLCYLETPVLRLVTYCLSLFTLTVLIALLQTVRDNSNERIPLSSAFMLSTIYMPLLYFYTPLKRSENQRFLCFQGVQKEITDVK